MVVKPNALIKKGNTIDQQVRIKEDSIVINIEFDYSIPISECATHQQVIKWVIQLCGKTWITPKVIERFIQVACKENNL